MTTIIATSDGMYSDSALTDNDAVFKVEKIFRINSKLVGCAGDTDLCGLFENQLRKSPNSPKRPHASISNDDNFVALVVDKEGIWFYDASFSKNLVLETFMAIGSGAQAARGAMSAGAPPPEAIEIACSLDAASMLPVQQLSLHK